MKANPPVRLSELRLSRTTGVGDYREGESKRQIKGIIYDVLFFIVIFIFTLFLENMHFLVCKW